MTIAKVLNVETRKKLYNLSNKLKKSPIDKWNSWALDIKEKEQNKK